MITWILIKASIEACDEASLNQSVVSNKTDFSDENIKTLSLRNPRRKNTDSQKQNKPAVKFTNTLFLFAKCLMQMQIQTIC